MKRKLLTIIAILAVIFVSAVLWRVDGFIFGDRMNWAEAQSRNQTVAIQHALQVELKALERLVYSFNAENFRKERLNWNGLQPYYAVGSLELNSHGVANVQNFFAKDKSSAATWNSGQVSQLLGKVDVPAANNIQIFAKPFRDPSQGRHVALLFVSQGKAYFLIGAGEIFQSLIDAQKGSLNSFSIVTKAGITAGHNVPEYTGTLLSEDPVYKAAAQSGVSQGSGIYRDSHDQEIFGLYTQIPNSNLLILSSASVADIMKGRGSLILQFLLLGIGLVLVGVAGMMIVIRPHEKGLQHLEEHAKALVAGKNDFPAQVLPSDLQQIDDLLGTLQAASTASVATPVTTSVAVAAQTAGQPSEQMQAKMEAYQRIASALGHEMKAPLTSILGYAQIVTSKVEDPEVLQSVESIVRESRAARNVLEKLFVFAGETGMDLQKSWLSEPLSDALKKVEPLLEQKGIRLEKDISSAASLPLSFVDLSRAFENVLMNAVEAMERMPSKEIKIKMYDQGDEVHLQIQDSGEGIEPAVLDKICDPFFTTRSFQNHTGLGLTVAMGILREHHADMKIQSRRGEGTLIHITFRKEAAQAQKASAVKVENELPAPIQAPPAALKEAQENALQELKKETTKSQETAQAPAAVNIDSLLDLPPADDNELSFIDGFLEDEQSKEEKQFVASLQDAPVDQDVPLAKVSVPKVPPPPPKRSRLDEFMVEIPKPPGKRS